MVATVLLPLALALASPAPPAASTRATAISETPFAALRRLDQRVATIGFRLSTAAAAADLCGAQQWQAGFVIHDRSQYSPSARAQLVRDFGLGEEPGVLAVAAGSPGEQAGLRRDDAIIAADGVALPHAPADAHDSYAPTEMMLTALDMAFADGVARLEIRRNGRALTVEIHAVKGCDTRFQLVPSGELNARADGRYVQITSAGAAFADTDDGLAAALAHELSHNILRHRARLNAAGVERGLLQHFGRNARLFRETEIEADRYSMYLLDRAGFSLPSALAYWERYARRQANLIPTTHPSWAVRLAAMRGEVAAIEHEKAGGRIPRPPAFDVPLT